MQQIDQLWVIVAAILVCFMQAGFLCLEAGAVRRKNSINVGAKNIYDLIISFGLFLVLGHLLMFGHTESGWFGNPLRSHFDIDQKVIILFHTIFAGTAATILSGSIAERMKFNSYLIIISVLSIAVYPIVGHWVWAEALIPGNLGWLQKLTFQDFAGCSVVHILGGTAALAVSLVLGPRLRRFGNEAVNMRSSDPSLSFLGLLLIWLGWFGFNGGSVLSVNSDLTKVIINTIFGGISGGIGGRLFQIIAKENQQNVWSMINGVLGGLVGITGGAIYFSTWESLVVGLIGGFIGVGGNKLLTKYKIDDVVGAIPVHLFSGIWGTLAVGIFGNHVQVWHSMSLLDRIGVQFIGILSIMSYTFIIIWLTTKLLKSTFGIRVSNADEIQGLNISEHEASTASYDMISAMKRQVDEKNFTESIDVEMGTEVGEISEMYNRVVRDMNKYANEEKELKRQIRFNNEQLKFQRDISNSVSKHINVEQGFSSILEQIITKGRLKGLQLFSYDSSKERVKLIKSGWILKGNIENNIETVDQSNGWRIDNHTVNSVINTLDQTFIKYDTTADSRTHQLLANDGIQWCIANPIIQNKSLVAVIVIFGGEDSIKPKYCLDNLTSISNSLSYLFEREISNNKLKKIAKEAQRANKAKTNFLAMMSHEIRTPMNGVLGMSSLLKETELNDEQKEYSDSIEESANSLLLIINDILDFTKFDSEGFQLEQVDFNLISLIEGCLDVISPKTRKKGIELLYIIDDQVPIYLAGDPSRLRQVILNLLGNAAKFTSKGEILLSVSTFDSSSSDAQIDDNQINLQFSVKDTGIGIKEKKISSLFESFTQADSSTNRKFGGTGLGLSISKKIVALMNGEIWAKSKLGEGSTFFFSVTLSEAQNKQKLIDTGYLSSENFDLLKGKRALVIDDNFTNRQILTKQLSNWGMQVDSKEDGKNINGFLKNQKAFDVILTDYQMPEVCGTKVALDIQESGIDTVPPVLMLSSVDKHIVLQDKDYREGVLSEILLKPTKQSKLFETLIKTIIDQKATFQKSVLQNEIKVLEETKYLNQNMAASHPLRILTVDDNQMNRRLCEIILERAGYKSDFAINGLDALNTIKKTYYDVIFMDIEMPEMDGLTAMKEIRKLETPAKDTHIIALTAAAMAGDRQKCFDHGADDYLSKPINRTLLINSLLNAYKKIEKDNGMTVAPVTNADIERIMDENLQEVTGNNEELMGQLISTFYQELFNVSRDLEEAHLEKDFDKIKQLAHSLKPNSKIFGDQELYKNCVTLELEALKKDEGKYGLLLDKIKQSIKRLQHIIENK
jgi:ammonium transporter